MSLKTLLTDLTTGVILHQQQGDLIMEILTHLFLKVYLDKSPLNLEKEEHQTDQEEHLVMNPICIVVY
jgi:hypothetical protein